MTKEELMDYCVYNTVEEVEEYIKKEEDFAKRYNVEPIYKTKIPHVTWNDPFENRCVMPNIKKEKMPIRDFVLFAREKGCKDDSIESFIVDYNGTLDCKDISVSAVEWVNIISMVKIEADIDFFCPPKR